MPSTISSVIKSPAMLAVINDTKVPEMKARKATLVIEGLRSGARTPKAAITIPIDPGLAKPQMAYVAIADDRSCNETVEIKLHLVTENTPA